MLAGLPALEPHAVSVASAVASQSLSTRLPTAQTPYQKPAPSLNPVLAPEPMAVCPAVEPSL